MSLPISKPRIAVFGLGYVGCVSAACLARDGFQVVGIDVDPFKVETVNAGKSAVTEPCLDQLIREGVNSGRLSAILDLHEAVAHSDLALICVGTPSTDAGQLDPTALRRVLTSLADSLNQTTHPYTVVIRSTVLPQLLLEQLLPEFEQACSHRTAPVHIALHPEFLREASAISDYDNPPFILAGSDDQTAIDQVFSLYPQLNCRKFPTDLRTASLVKYASNAWHATKIAFANEIGTLSRAFGADGRSVMELLCADHKLNISTAYLKPGFAFGGSCLTKDLAALNSATAASQLELPLLSSVVPSNETHIDRALQRILNSSSERIAIVGLSFKPGTDDLRESPFLKLAARLIAAGREVRIFDANVSFGQLTGGNLHYVASVLPRLADHLVTDLSELLRWSSLAVICHGKLPADPPDSSLEIIDLSSALVSPGSEPVPALPTN